MASTTLNELQKEFLEKFFSHENRFFLSGGAALVGFYLHHRQTQDIDLFTLEDEIESGFTLANEIAREMGGNIESLQTSPDFRRLLLSRGESAIVVDLVHEYVYQIDHDKRIVGGIRIDTPEEILANKLCALLSRSEVRDLVDVRALEMTGFSIAAAVNAASKKDSGFTPAQLAWVLSEIRFGEDLVPPGNVSLNELQAYLKDLLARLSRMAFPGK